VLVLLDIDGTLLGGAAGGHAQAIREAVHEVWDLETVPEVDFQVAGMTDLLIARTLLAGAGVEDDEVVDEGLERFAERAVERYRELVEDDLTHTVLPGVPEMLDALAGREGWVTTLLTGNLREVARLKLGAAGIAGPIDFSQGAYGSDAEDRGALPAIARVRAGLPWPRERTVVVGDTPRDIACARADGVHVVAVASGAYDAAELAEADAVVARADEVPAAIDALAG
jgi:phosphoglycolate phosphatase